jgi:diguanylate cyclase (GGDEF)-like protein/PAS domain S-box-containing protein
MTYTSIALDDHTDSEGLRWRTALEASQQGLWEVDYSAETVYRSTAWFGLRGLSPSNVEAATHDAWFARVHPDDQALVKSFSDGEREDEYAAFGMEYRERHADGHYIWILSRSKTITDDSTGLKRRTVGTDTDITSFKMAQEKLKRLTHTMDLAISASKIGVWEYLLADKVPFWDARMREIFGLSDAGPTLAADAWEKALHPDDYARATQIAEDVAQNGGSYDMSYRIVTPTGDVRHVCCRAKYYEDRTTGPKLVGMTWDVSDIRQRELDLDQALMIAEQRQAELEQAKAVMEFRSLHDPVTGLGNRRKLDERLATLANADVGRVALMHLDLDRFKQINDTFGHAVGDAILTHVAAELTSTFGEEALVCRTGGDEFVVLLENAKPEAELLVMADALLLKLREPLVCDGHECRFGASMGLAFAEGQGSCTKQLLINADIALYRAKNEGRNRRCVFTREMQAAMVSHKRCSDDILRGLDSGEFCPVYQLQFDARSHDVVGMEALVRWTHPQRGVLDPSQFLRVAEDINVVHRIDDAVLTQAIADKAMWEASGLVVPHISVNVSARRLRETDLISRVAQLGLPPDSFSFELVESINLEDPDEDFATKIKQLRDLGIGIEIDDFGTGHASVSGLLKLRPDRFKIDRHLVSPIVESPEQRRLVASMIDIGRALGIGVIAEGVETLEHAQILSLLGCHTLQGFAFAKPIPAAEVAGFIERQAWRMAA